MDRGALILIGDSHALHFAELAKDTADELHMRSIVIAEGATPFPTLNVSTPTGGLTLGKNQENNAKMTKEVNRELEEIDQNRDNLILLSSFYRLYFDPPPPAGLRRYETLTHYQATGDRISSQESFDDWLGDLAQFAHEYQKARIIVFLSTPEMADIYPEALCRKEWFRPTISNHCSVSVPRGQMLATLATLNRKISERASRLANVVVFDPTPSLCPPNQ